MPPRTDPGIGDGVRQVVPLSSVGVSLYRYCQGRGNYFEVGGGGAKSPGVQGNPHTQNKKVPGFGPLF